METRCHTVSNASEKVDRHRASDDWGGDSDGNGELDKAEDPGGVEMEMANDDNVFGNREKDGGILGVEGYVFQVKEDLLEKCADENG